MIQRLRALLIFGILSLLSGCGGGGSTFSTPPTVPPATPFSFTLSSSSVTVVQGGSPVNIDIILSHSPTTSSFGLNIAGGPVGLQTHSTGPGTSSTFSLSIAPGSAAPGTYNINLTCIDSSGSATQPLTVTVAVSATVTPIVSGHLDLAMSTSFQPAEWDWQFFNNVPTAATSLGNLNPQHVRLQAVSQGVPQKTATTWDFTMLDAIANPVLTTGDHSPQFQIAVAPAFMYDANHKLRDLTFQEFADYSAQLVRYYNTGGFTAPDGHHASSSAFPITHWGIFNEPNLNNLTPTEYTALYNKTVPAMQAVDPTLKFVAVELSDFGSENTRFIPTFVNSVTAPVDVMATHFYASCNQRDADKQLFDNVPDFARRITYLYSQMATKPALANVPVWITENNVNADYDKGGGISACNNTAFTSDVRGSSAFFAAWRPYMFSQVGKAGARSLYQWVFAADGQYGEINDQTGKPRLSYWVDYWLQHYFPSPPGADLLQVTTTDDQEIEVLAARNPDGSVILMVVNRAIASSVDNNGAGAPRTVSLDLSQLGAFTTAKLLKINAQTDAVNGPTEASVGVSSRIEISFPGYGVAFLTLQ